MRRASPAWRAVQCLLACLAGAARAEPGGAAAEVVSRHPGRTRRAPALLQISSNLRHREAAEGVQAGRELSQLPAQLGAALPQQPARTVRFELSQLPAQPGVPLPRAPLESGLLAADSAYGAGLAAVFPVTESFADSVKGGAVTIVFGLIFFLIAIPIQWFNEERSVKMETLLLRGLSECIAISADSVDETNRGRLVHVQGRARGAATLVDEQFRDAKVKRCLKLQSTVEVFEWVRTTRTWSEGKERRKQPRFHTEWTTMHHDSTKFRSVHAAPENPRLPSGLMLGTFTRTCRRVQLGAFDLTEEMVNLFRRFEPANLYLPPVVTAHGLTFFQNREDGYYYMRPGHPAARSPGADLFVDHQVGDVRARFMCVPESEATVVAVQCEKEECETFVPYRPIPRAPCTAEWQERQKLIEEGDRPLQDLGREIACCPSGVGATCCCPCKAIACCCSSEIITEEIFYVSDRLDPMEKPFLRDVVHRNPCRVWNFRLLGWGIMFLGVGMILGPFSGLLRSAPGLHAYGSAAPLVLAALLTMVIATLVMSAVYACYRPIVSVMWLLAIVVIVLVPLVWGSVGS